ncbi:hypothetical protein R1T15_13255, partial [Mucilaginibacter sp. L3T2-6]|uniref:hypothetical protein n=1 Tax=Mucilaginibacter sp. L3T2-6 TaxID=3062491 RepID=UPI00294A3DCA
MNFIIISFQLLTGLLSLIAAIVATFRPKLFGFLAPMFQPAGLKRIIQAVGHWIALIATLLGIAVPFMVFFASCIALASSLPLLLRAALLRVIAHQVTFAILLISTSKINLSVRW